MEDKFKFRKGLDIHKELKDSAQLYINVDYLYLLISPLLKYGLYNLNLFEAFKDRIKDINIDIETLKEKLKIIK